MGIYLNPGNTKFKETIQSQIYVDKSLLIKYTNEIMMTMDKYLCVSRPRRFGKSTDAQMLCAYYGKNCESNDLFQNLSISAAASYQTHLNQHHVVFLNMQDFLCMTESIKEMISRIEEWIIDELIQVYPAFRTEIKLSRFFDKIFAAAQDQFVFIIDEWDCIFREYQNDKDSQKLYLDFLRNLFKDKSYVSLVYMTGILPIKKYGSHSALNMFDEISMINSIPLTEFMGFTEQEVKEICKTYDMNFNDMKAWYDGYHLRKDISIYSPRSVVKAALKHNYDNYWTQTETYEALKVYIEKNVDGLKDSVVALLAGKNVKINVDTFVNDMTTMNKKDDVLTLLVHLGYLGYHSYDKTVYIPNAEVRSSFVAATESPTYQTVNKILKDSDDLLHATWEMNSEKVVQYIERAHYETSILQYNDENALSYAVSLAYFTARDEYTIVREFASGKGYADLVFIPIHDKPAMIIELKWDQTSESAMEQIKEKQYGFGLEKYKDHLLIIGISYDRKTKKHACIIEKYIENKGE